MPQLNQDAQDALADFATNPRLAHDFFFEHRHPEITPDFHYEIIDLFHGEERQVLIEAFRGAAKSTITEDGIVLEAIFGWLKNGIILSASRDQAIEHLRSIKHEIEHNEKIIAFFGYLGGTSADVWNEDEIILANGVRIQALGRGQSFRGTKHLDARPDRLWFDDLEDDESARDELSCEAVKLWFLKVALPAVDNKRAKIRGLATPLHPKSLVMQLRDMDNWTTKVYPIKFIDAATGEWWPTWEDKYPMEWIDAKEKEMHSLGAHQEFAQEYMCQPEDPAAKLFTADLIKVRPQIHTWQATYVAYDPARSTNKQSATTGWAVFSWIGNKLVVWDGGGDRWKPAELLDHIFAVNERYHPVSIGVEIQGLHEFIMQPLRQAQLVRHDVLSLEILRPPKDKKNFIRSLQPLFVAGEVEFAQSLKEAAAQLLSFPTGKIDFPNALAYALLMKPGTPIYLDFSPTTHIAEKIFLVKSRPLFLVVGATNQYTTGQLVQVIDGGLHVANDWVREGAPGDRLSDIVRDAGLACGRSFSFYAGPEHFKDFDTIGLRAAANQIPVVIRSAGAAGSGRADLRTLLQTQRAGQPRVQVSTDARWTLNAFAGGYCRRLAKTGQLTEEPQPGAYATLMQALESFVAVMHYAGERETVHYARTPEGRRYISARAGEPVAPPTKDNWHGQAE
jgi:hypothetical protein